MRPWNLDLLPPFLPPLLDVRNKSANVLIPQHVWVPITEAKGASQLGHLRKMQRDNPGWNFHVEGNQEKLQFMETFFPNTSLLWAYKAINPLVGASAADLWRYSVLWLFGGLAMDDDSTFKHPLNSILRTDDTLLLTFEKFDYVDKCYKPSYHLSGANLDARMRHSGGSARASTSSSGSSSGSSSSSSSSSSGDGDSGTSDADLLAAPFRGKNLGIWAIFAAPRQPAMLRVLRNAVEIIRKEYLRQSVLYIPSTETKSLYVFCVTGPSFFTASMRELVLDRTLHAPGAAARWYRLTGDRNFNEVGGVPKIPNKNDPKEKHYTHRLQHQRVAFLARYAADYDAETLDGRIVRCADAAAPGTCAPLLASFVPSPGGGGGGGDSSSSSVVVVVVQDLQVVRGGRLWLARNNETLLAVSMETGPPIDVPAAALRRFASSNALADPTAAAPARILLPVLRHRSLEGQLLTASFKTFSLIVNGTRRGFHDWDTFSSFNYSLSSAKEVDEALLRRLPAGPVYMRSSAMVK